MRDDIREAIDRERERQRAKWAGHHDWGAGDCSAPTVARVVKSTVLGEEVGEVARAVLDSDHQNLIEELTQVAAVAVAWLELEMA